MSYKQKTDCLKWQFDGIPEFGRGEMHPLFADCGSGLSKIPDTKTADNTFMHFFCGTSAEDVKEYSALLENEGFEKIYENIICGNLFFQFASDKGLLYISHMKNSAVTRIILDRCRTAKANSFGYCEYNAVRSDSEFAQYSLYYGKMIKGKTCDCGMNYVYRLRDNSLIIIDGGEMEQATDAAAADYIRFLHELTQTSENEKLTVSLWICTHAHNDHCDFMSKLIRFHSDEIMIERIAFNFPNPQNTRHSPSVNALKHRLCEKYPNAAYLKPHAGTAFSIANAQIEVLVSGEDTMGLDKDDPFPGTNSTSLIFRIIADGISTLFLADCSDDNGSVLIENYGSNVTDCNLLQAAHHGINRIYDVYEKLNAEKILLPQCRMNMDTRFSDVYAHLCVRFGEKNILFANDATYIFTLNDGKYSIREREQVGTEYDKSDW